MKTFVLAVFVLFSFVGFAQQNPLAREYADRLLDINDFNTLIKRDLTFLIVGEKNPTQGLDFELNDDKTKITAGGFLNILNGLMTLEGDLSADDGVYFFNDDGAKKASISFNYFRAFGGLGGYNIDSNANTQRIYIKKALLKADTLLTIKRDYIFLYQYLRANGIPVEQVKDLDEEFTETNKVNDSKINYSIKKEFLLSNFQYIKDEYDKKYFNPNGGGKTRSVEIYEEDLKEDSDEVLRHSFKLKYSLKTLELIEDYQKAKERFDNRNTTMANLNIENSASAWNYRSLKFLSFSGSYSRESLDIYNQNSDADTLSKRFHDTKGDLFKLNSSFNFYKLFKRGYYLFFKGGIGVGRASNISSFSKKTFQVSLPIGQLTEDTDITNIQSQEGYTGANRYKYGFLKEGTVEVYFGGKVLGIFSKIGYEKIEYNEDGIKDFETYPWRCGLIFNLKSKSDKATSLILQIFVNRENLNLHPKADDDLNYGLSVGLPINIRKKL